MGDKMEWGAGELTHAFTSNRRRRTEVMRACTTAVDSKQTKLGKPTEGTKGGRGE